MLEEGDSLVMELLLWTRPFVDLHELTGASLRG